MKTITSMPSFTAEFTLSDNEANYRCASRAVAQSGIVQPAHYRSDAGLPCLKFKYKCDEPDDCGWQTSIGHVNPATGRCE
jgi:hypothetical protein